MTTRNFTRSDDVSPPRTSDALVALRLKAVKFLVQVDRELKGEPEHPALDRLRDPKIAFTCDGCGRATVCLYTFDPYNTDGDCLDDK